MLKRLFFIVIFLGFLIAIAAGIFLTWGYYYVTRDLPSLKSVEDYKPEAVSFIYAADGSPIAEFYKKRRYPIKIKDVPQIVKQCFLATEDKDFYHHPGISFKGIIRAAVKNFMSGERRQGGSTITQQVVKNLVLTPRKDYTRKIKEAILSYQLEKRLSKDDILEIYLNEIFFGNTAYGLGAAARIYFHKDVKDLTLGEASLLAGLPQAPSENSPIARPKKAKRRQKEVLDHMLRAGFINAEQANAASLEELNIFPASSQNIFAAPYFVGEVRRVLLEKWPDLDIDVDALKIYTSVDLSAESMAERSLRIGLKDVDKRRGWRGPLEYIKSRSKAEYLQRYGNKIGETLSSRVIYPALVTELSGKKGVAEIEIGEYSFELNLNNAAWAKKKIDNQDQVTWVSLEQAIRPGDVIEVSLIEREKKSGSKNSYDAILDQTPDIEGAVILIDPHSGRVVSLIGGYSYQRSQYNRVTQSLRQPGSAFKPIVYLSAVDGFKYTPATIVYDTPRSFRVGEEFWTPGNFDEKYLGAITLREALEKSRNLVSADIVSRIGVDVIIRYAKAMGIESHLGQNLSIALGSSEVTLLELTRAYGVLAAKGVLFPTSFIDKILDREGNVIYDYTNEKLSLAKQVVNENSAFIMSYMMKGVIEHGTGYRVKEIKRPVAGKTGTSNDQMDAWFIGFTPQWVCGVWTGFDLKKSIGDKETGGRVAAPIWLNFMRDFLNAEDSKQYAMLVEEAKAEAEKLGIEYIAPQALVPIDFSVPDGVDPFWVNKSTGVLSDPSDPGAIYEYFTKGTEPAKALQEEDVTQSYLDSPEL